MNINVLILKILKKFLLHWAFENLSIEEVGGGGMEETQVTLSLRLPPPLPPPNPPGISRKAVSLLFQIFTRGGGGEGP
jgi:hypothetical protein